MKQFYTVLAILFMATATAQVKNANAHDLIIKNDKTEVKAKVLEIQDEKVTYKKQDNLNGPTYSLLKSEIFMILYANGTKETFEETVATPEPASAPSQPKFVLAPATGETSAAVKPNVAKGPFNYAPIRFTYNPKEGYDWALVFMIDYAVNDVSALDAPLFSHINVGINLNGGGYTYDEYSVGVIDLGLYLNLYVPLNKLMGSKNPNTGFFPYTYLGGVVRQTSSDFDGESVTDYGGDLSWGVGMDYKFTRGFGLTVLYDINWGAGAGINFNF